MADTASYAPIAVKSSQAHITFTSGFANKTDSVTFIPRSVLLAFCLATTSASGAFSKIPSLMPSPLRMTASTSSWARISALPFPPCSALIHSAAALPMAYPILYSSREPSICALLTGCASADTTIPFSLAWSTTVFRAFSSKGDIIIPSTSRCTASST